VGRGEGAGGGVLLGHGGDGVVADGLLGAAEQRRLHAGLGGLENIGLGVTLTPQYRPNLQVTEEYPILKAVASFPTDHRIVRCPF